MTMSKKRLRPKVPSRDFQDRVQFCLNQVREQFFNENCNQLTRGGGRNVFSNQKPILKKRKKIQKCCQPEKYKPHPFAPNRKFMPANLENCEKVNKKPKRCRINATNFCACNSDEEALVRILPKSPSVTYCADQNNKQGGCGCSSQRYPVINERCPPKKRPINCLPDRCKPIRCPPIKCSPERCQPICPPERCRPIKCPPEKCQPICPPERCPPERCQPICKIRYPPEMCQPICKIRCPPIKCPPSRCPPIRYSIDRCCCSGKCPSERRPTGRCCTERLKTNTSCRVGDYVVSACCCDSCGDPIEDKNFCCEIKTACMEIPKCPLTQEQIVCDCCGQEDNCCEHGVPFSNSCCEIPDSAIPQTTTCKERERPVVIVNNTDLCECEEKWEQIERWKKKAARREEKQKNLELEREIDEARVKCKERLDAQRRREESKERHRQEECQRKKEERRRRREQREMEERQLDVEDRRWLEELADREEERRFIASQERKRDERKWRRDQLKARTTSGNAVPELEEMRRALAPVQQGPNEIFEYFTSEPRVPTAERIETSKAIVPVSNAIVPAVPAPLTFDKQHGFHLKLPSGQQAKTTVQLRMGPPGCEGMTRTYNITGEDPCALCVGGNNNVTTIPTMYGGGNMGNGGGGGYNNYVPPGAMGGVPCYGSPPGYNNNNYMQPGQMGGGPTWGGGAGYNNPMQANPIGRPAWGGTAPGFNNMPPAVMGGGASWNGDSMQGAAMPGLSVGGGGGCNNNNILPGDIQAAMAKIKELFNPSCNQTTSYPVARAAPSPYFPTYGYYPYC